MCAKHRCLVSVEARSVWWERKVLRNGGEKWGKKKSSQGLGGLVQEFDVGLQIMGSMRSF